MQRRNAPSPTAEQLQDSMEEDQTMAAPARTVEDDLAKKFLFAASTPALAADDFSTRSALQIKIETTSTKDALEQEKWNNLFWVVEPQELCNLMIQIHWQGSFPHLI